MSIIQMKELKMHSVDGFPKVGDKAPDFSLTKTDLSTVTLADYKGKTVLFNVYPSIDTVVCFESVKRFNAIQSRDENSVIVCVSMDLPFALKRIGDAEQYNNVDLLSDFRNREFGEQYGLTILDGPLAGLLARAVIIVDANQRVTYTELVDDITNSPDYDRAIKQICS